MTKIKTRPGTCGRSLLSHSSKTPWTAGTAALLSLAATPYTSTVYAQEPGADRLDEVVVTARRREESEQTVPIAITAFGAGALEDKHITTLESIQSAVPEFSMSQASGRPNAPVYGLRGIRPTEAIFGQDPTVAVYFADVVMSPSENTNLGLYDLASLQVLKGPQGTLFGRNTTGGALLLTPKRPGKEFGGEAMVGVGNYGKYEAQIGVDLPVNDSFAMRLAGRFIDSDGYQTNVAPGPLYGSKLGGEDTKNVRLSLVWNITDSVENYSVLNYDKKSTNGRGLVLQALNPNSNAPSHCYDGPGNPLGGSPPLANRDGTTPGPNAGLPTGGCNNSNTPSNVTGATPNAIDNTATGLPNYWDALARAQNRSVNDIESDMPQFDRIETWGLVNTTTAKLGDDLTLKGIGGYHDFRASSFLDLDASAIPGFLTSMQTEAMKSASYELQLLGEALDKRFNWVTGLYWYYEDGFQNSPGNVSEGLSASPLFIQRGDVHNNTYSVFAQGDYDFTSSLSMTAGVRWTKDEKEMTISTHTLSNCVLSDPITNVRISTLAGCSVTLSDSFSKPTGTLSLNYKLSSDVLLYATTRYGYRAGGFNLRGTDPVTYQPFDPETVTDLELGTKADWSIGDWKMRTNAAVYNQWYNDIQRTVGVSSASGVPSSAVQNAAKATVFGVELQQTIQPTRNFLLQLSYAFTNPKYNDWTEKNLDLSTPTDTVLTDLSSTPFHFTPKHSASGTVTYTIPLANASEELSFSAGASYRSHVWINALQTIQAINRTPVSVQPLLQQGGYTTFDLNAGWKSIGGTKLDLGAYVRNAGDKEFAVGGLQLYESAYNSVSRTGALARAYGEPRTFGAELRYHF
jgi:iron complex outermembrane receptor protein